MTEPNSLSDVVREFDEHIAQAGWDQPVQLFAIMRGSPTEQDESVVDQNATAIPFMFEPQGVDFGDGAIIDVLRTLEWDQAIEGLAIAAERIISVENKEATDYEHESYNTTQEIRVLAIALRSGETINALRYRSFDNADDVLVGQNLVPELNQTLLQSLSTD